MNSNDLRFIKTEENLKKALLCLLEHHGIEDVSITALCREAKCSRNAFYQHYETKYDLYDAILKGILETLKKSAWPLRMDQRTMGEKEIQEFTYRLLSILHDRKNDLLSLIHENDLFVVFLSNSLYEAFLQNYSLVTDPQKITERGRLLTRYFCSGITGFIVQWLLEGKQDLEEAQRQLDTCTRDNLRKMRDLLIE